MGAAAEEASAGSGRGGAGAPAMADRKMYRGSSRLVVAKRARADSWVPSKFDKSGRLRTTLTPVGGEEEVVAGALLSVVGGGG